MFSSIKHLKKLFSFVLFFQTVIIACLIYYMIIFNQYDMTLYVVVIAIFVSLIILYFGFIKALREIHGELEAKTTSLTNEINNLRKALNKLTNQE